MSDQPDTSAARLEAIQKRHAIVSANGPRRDRHAERGDLLAMLDAAHNTIAHDARAIHDLQCEMPAYQRGRDSAFAEVLDMLRVYRAEQEKEDAKATTGYFKGTCIGRIQASHWIIDAVLEMTGLQPGKRPPTLPPDDLRREVERLRAALERIAGMGTGNYPAVQMVEIATRALEGTP